MKVVLICIALLMGTISEIWLRAGDCFLRKIDLNLISNKIIGECWMSMALKFWESQDYTPGTIMITWKKSISSTSQVARKNPKKTILVLKWKGKKQPQGNNPGLNLNLDRTHKRLMVQLTRSCKNPRRSRMYTRTVKCQRWYKFPRKIHCNRLNHMAFNRILIRMASRLPVLWKGFPLLISGRIMNSMGRKAFEILIKPRIGISLLRNLMILSKKRSKILRKI